MECHFHYFDNIPVHRIARKCKVVQIDDDDDVDPLVVVVTLFGRYRCCGAMMASAAHH